MKQQKTLEQQTAEQATGCAENRHGIGQFYAGPINSNGMTSESGSPLTTEQAKDYLWSLGQVAVPNAGAGSYRQVFADLGFPTVKVWDWTSSAGDWTFLVFDGENWFIAWQENRYPRAGFNYSIESNRPFSQLEELQNWIIDHS